MHPAVFLLQSFSRERDYQNMDFFILYPGIIVYVVFCGGLQARITVLMLERELVFSCGQVYMHSLWV